MSAPTQPLIADVGRYLFGPRWQSEMARALGVSIRTVQRWAAGEIEPPEGAYRETLRLIHRQQAGAPEMARKIEARLTSS